MTDAFFERPILNSPYEYPSRHWELDETGQPTSAILERRRTAKFVTPIPRPKKRGKTVQTDMVFDADDVSTDDQKYDPTPIINLVRSEVDRWRREPASAWGVTPETSRLLQHWRHHPFANLRPFFCQVEAVEMAPGFTSKSNAK